MHIKTKQKLNFFFLITHLSAITVDLNRIHVFWMSLSLSNCQIQIQDV